MYGVYDGLIKRILSLLFMLGFMLIAVTACGSDLSRGKAENMIKKYAQKNPIKYTIDIGNENGIVDIVYKMDKYDQQHQQEPLGKDFIEATMFVKLQKKGLMNYEMIRKRVQSVYSPSMCFDEFRVELTSKAKPYIIKEYLLEAVGIKMKKVEVILATVDKVEVLRITKPENLFGKKMCEVNYRIHYKLTPFGEVYSDQENIKQELDGGERRMPFVLYDDGWRPAR